MATAPITDVPAGDTPSAGSIAAIVVNYRTPALALRCVEALVCERDALPDLTILLVDGGSRDASAELLRDGLRKAPWGSLVEFVPLPINGGFGYANNQALLHLAQVGRPAERIFLVNPDAQIRPGALARLATLMAAQPRAGAIGAQLRGEDGGIQGSAFTFPTVASEFSRGANTDVVRRLLHVPEPTVTPPGAARVPWVTGAAVLLRTAALRQTGLFDDGFFLYFEEVELMHRLTRAGWEIWHDPQAHVMHEGGSSTDIKWGAGGFHKPIALPAYWYASRRRYFVRTGGRARAVAAGLAFLAGRLIWLLRVRVQRRRDSFPVHTSRDTLRHSLWPNAADRMATLPRLDDAPGARPAWMPPPRAG